jgi:hypothetical protein
VHAARSMSRRRRPVLGGGLAVAIVTSVAPPLLAQDEPAHRVALTFRAPASCPDEAAFRTEVDRRTDRVTWSPEAPDMRFDVAIDEAKKGFTATIRVTADGSESTRNLDGARCDEVIGALGFIAALAADPTVMTRPPPPVISAPSGPPPPVPPSVLGAGSPGTPTSRVNSAERPPPGRYASGAFDLRPAPLPIWTPTSARERDLGFGIVADATLDLGATPLPLLGFTGGVALSGELFRVRAAFGYAASPSWTASDAPAGLDPADGGFRLLRGRVDGCVPRFEPTRGLSIFPCARFELGAITATLARGTEPAGPDAENLWVAPGLLGLVVLEPVPELSLALALGATIPLQRARYLDTSVELYAAWPIIPQVGLEIGFFP